MRKKIEWVPLTRLSSDVELEFFMKQFPKSTTGHSNTSNCNLCLDNNDMHLMRRSYPYCQCGSPDCQARCCIEKCVKNKLIVVKGISIHQPKTHKGK